MTWGIIQKCIPKCVITHDQHVTQMRLKKFVEGMHLDIAALLLSLKMFCLCPGLTAALSNMDDMTVKK